VGQENIKIEEAVVAVKNWFIGRNRRWLVVFDSADTIDNDEDDSYIDIESFLPIDPSVHIIITTRSATAREMTSLEIIEVAEMEWGEAIELFIRSAKISQLPVATTAEIKLIMEELGFLALAISLAGSYVSVTPRLRSNIRLYLPEYRERRKQLLAQKPKRLVHRYGENVLTTWETTFNAISSKSPEASRLLTLLAFIHFDDIFVELFNYSINSSADSDQSRTKRLESLWMQLVSASDSVHLYMLETALQVLESYSLVQWKPEQNSYFLYKLVHAWAHDRLDVQE
jgi:hypothetical protein